MPGIGISLSRLIHGLLLNQSDITDAMLFEDEDVYMSSEDEVDVYLQLVE